MLMKLHSEIQIVPLQKIFLNLNGTFTSNWGLEIFYFKGMIQNGMITLSSNIVFVCTAEHRHNNAGLNPWTCLAIDSRKIPLLGLNVKICIIAGLSWAS